MTTRRGRSDAGSAVVAAVFVAASVALVASQVVSTSRSAIQAASGALVHARLEAQAEGEVARAVANIGSGAWDLGRAPHALDDADETGTVVIEDERGKAPLNTLGEAQVRSLFQAGGVDGSELDALTAAFLDWRDPNRTRRSSASAGSAAAAPAGSQEGGFRTLGELRLVPGVSDALYDALAPSITVSAGDRAYDPTYSPPLAVAVMTGQGLGSPQAIEAAREADGEKPALSTTAPESLAGRALTIRVTLQRPDGARYQGAWLIELTGRENRPYIVRGRAD